MDKPALEVIGEQYILAIERRDMLAAQLTELTKQRQDADKLVTEAYKPLNQALENGQAVNVRDRIFAKVSGTTYNLRRL